MIIGHVQLYYFYRPYSFFQYLLGTLALNLNLTSQCNTISIDKKGQYNLYKSPSC